MFPSDPDEQFICIESEQNKRNREERYSLGDLRLAVQADGKYTEIY